MNLISPEFAQNLIQSGRILLLFIGPFLFSFVILPEAVKCLSRLLQSLITVTGPELAMDTNLLGIVKATLAVLESTTEVREAISCIQRLQMFVPEHDNLPRILPRLCEYLKNGSPQLRVSQVKLKRGRFQAKKNL